MTFTKLDQVDLGSLCQELSNGGLGFGVALQSFLGINVRVLVLKKQSMLSLERKKTVGLYVGEASTVEI